MKFCEHPPGESQSGACVSQDRRVMIVVALVLFELLLKLDAPPSGPAKPPYSPQSRSVPLSTLSLMRGKEAHFTRESRSPITRGVWRAEFESASLKPNASLDNSFFLSPIFSLPPLPVLLPNASPALVFSSRRRARQRSSNIYDGNQLHSTQHLHMCPFI